MNITRKWNVLIGLLAATASGPAASAEPVEVSRVASRLGITPEAVVLAGFSAQDAGTMLSRLQTVSPVREQLAAAETAIDVASSELSEASSRATAGVTDQATSNDIATAEIELSDAQTDHAALLSALWLTATAELDQANVDRLEELRASGSFRGPAEFRALTGSFTDWDLLERALKQEARCDRTGEQLRSDYSTLLSDLREDEAVEDAAEALELYLAGVAAAFLN